MEIHGFRGITQLDLKITSAITALSGLNGTGKSTIAQLAACAYRSLPGSSRRRYYVRGFFPVSAADPQPFSRQARVVYS
jgi:predicted ATP-dependent endonuclease of OLD family